MNEPDNSNASGSELTGEQRSSALFAQLVMQQANMALMLLGKIAHPQSGEVTKDTDAARFFIDQLEMLQAKTKGNLSKDENELLKQALMNLHLAFVEAVESPATAPASQPAAAPSGPEPALATPGTTASEDEHRKKFTKKY
jgi:hypothetical protein